MKSQRVNELLATKDDKEQTTSDAPKRHKPAHAMALSYCLFRGSPSNPVAWSDTLESNSARHLRMCAQRWRPWQKHSSPIKKNSLRAFRLVPTQGSNPRNALRLRSPFFAIVCKSACYVRDSKIQKSRRSEQKRSETKKFCHQLSSRSTPLGDPLCLPIDSY